MPYPYAMDENNTGFWKEQENEELRKEFFRVYSDLMSVSRRLEQLSVWPQLPNSVDLTVKHLGGKAETLALELSCTLPGVIEAENETTQGW